MISNTQGFGLGLITLAAAAYIADRLVQRFRRNVKAGDIVAVDFGNALVLNRTVIAASELDVLVRGAHWEHRTDKIPRSDVYMATSQEPVDEIVPR